MTRNSKSSRSLVRPSLARRIALLRLTTMRAATRLKALVMPIGAVNYKSSCDWTAYFEP